jgi:predicted secreted protein
MLRAGLCVFATGLLVSSAAVAEPPTPFPKDQVSFRVEAKREVPNDWIAATLGVEEESSDVAGLAARVNQRMAAALALVKGDQRLQVSSGAYQTQPVYDRTRIVRWRASQDLVIETAEVDVLAQMAGTLQAQGLLLRGISFSVSPETRKRIEDELILEVLSLFRERAGLMARGLGRRGWNLMSLALGEWAPPPMPFHQTRGMAMEAADAAVAPAFESGRSTLRVEANASIEVE